MAHFVWVRGLLVRVTVRSRQVTCDDSQPLRSFTLLVSNYYLSSYVPGGVPAPLREASRCRNRAAVDSAQRVSRYSPDGTDAPSGGAPSPKRSWDGRMLL